VAAAGRCLLRSRFMDESERARRALETGDLADFVPAEQVLGRTGLTGYGRGALPGSELPLPLRTRRPPSGKASALGRSPYQVSAVQRSGATFLRGRGAALDGDLTAARDGFHEISRARHSGCSPATSCAGTISTGNGRCARNDSSPLTCATCS
jgi:hypothetical protein